MRKVYHNKSSISGLPLAVAIGAGMTALVFGVLPFSHVVNKPDRTLELRKAAAADLPPPVEEESLEKPPEMEQPEQAPEAPQLAEAPQQIPISADLEVAMGSGGAIAGFGEIRALTETQTIQDEVFDVSELEKQPEVVSQTAPVYPPELRKARIEGVAKLLFVINEEGRVEDPRVESSTHAEFEKAALEALRKWRFRPGIKDGQPVRVYRSIPIRFRMQS